MIIRLLLVEKVISGGGGGVIREEERVRFRCVTPLSEVIIFYLRPCLILLYTRVPGSHGNIITFNVCFRPS